MNETTRRGFLGLLAHAPFVGVLFAGHLRATNSDKELRDRLKQEEAEAVRKAQAEVRFIRWIPVTERLPECRCGKLQPGRQEEYSGAVLVCNASDHSRTNFRRTEMAHLERHTGALGENRFELLIWRDDNDSATALNAFTHWAELPAPPSEVPA